MINRILKHIRTENITDTNILIKAVIFYVGQKTGLKACGSKKRNQYPGGKEELISTGG